MNMAFRVLYKLRSAQKSVTVDHIMDDLKDLMTFLARDGINKDTVEYLYVHYTPANSNETMELVCVDNNTRPVETAAPKKSADIIPINRVAHIRKAVERSTKPRISLKELPDMGLVHTSLFTAMRGDYNVAVS